MNAYSIPGIVREFSLEGIERAVCNYFEISPGVMITPDMLRAPTRVQEVRIPRQIAMYFMRQVHTKGTLDNISKHFGGMNRSTVLNACVRVEELIAIRDPDFFPIIKKLIKQFES